MENSYVSYSNGNLTDPGLQIIRHPSYQLPSRFLLPWFDIRVFYVRISNFLVDDSTPECLTLGLIPFSPNTILEVNGVRCSMDLEGMSCVLRRDRVDKKSEEATFISTDSIRLTGGVKLEVFDKEDLVISGVLEMSDSNGNRESNHIANKWVMRCESVISAAVGFLKGKQITGHESSLPTIEVYVAGCLSGTPIILTQTLQINHHKKHRKGTLHSIPEHDVSALHEYTASGQDLQVAEYKIYRLENEEDYDSLFCRQTLYMEGEDGELSWFNAGVRVGVGIGLSICLGVGIGVGLLVRTYQSTTSTFKRRLL